MRTEKARRKGGRHLWPGAHQRKSPSLEKSKGGERPKEPKTWVAEERHVLRVGKKGGARKTEPDYKGTLEGKGDRKL